MSPSPRIQVGREAPSGAQPQEPAGRARSPSRRARVRGSLRSGSRAATQRRTPDPTHPPPAQAGTNPNETGSRSRTGEEDALAGEGIFSPVALCRWFGAPGEQAPSPAAPYPTQGEHTGGPQRGQRILPGLPTRPGESALPGMQAGPGLRVARLAGTRLRCGRPGIWLPATHRRPDSPAEGSAVEGPTRQRVPEVAADLPVNEVILDELSEEGELLSAVGLAVNRFLCGLHVDFSHKLCVQIGPFLHTSPRKRIMIFFSKHSQSLTLFYFLKTRKDIYFCHFKNKGTEKYVFEY